MNTGSGRSATPLGFKPLWARRYWPKAARSKASPSWSERQRWAGSRTASGSSAKHGSRLATGTAVDAGGSRVALTDRLGENATVVVFWSRYCGWSHQAMQSIVELSRELAAAGVPLLAVTGDAPEEARNYLQEEGWDLEVLFDVEGTMSAAFNQWATPKYYVLDGDGRLRFISSLDDLPRHVAALNGG